MTTIMASETWQVVWRPLKKKINLFEIFFSERAINLGV